MAAETPRPAEGPRKPRQRHRRLSMSEMSKLIKEYEQGALVKELAERFGVHRATVTALLEWHEVELRRSGLVREVIPIVARMYSQGWSCARLGDLFDVDASTVWRALRAAGLTMRSPSERPSRSHRLLIRTSQCQHFRWNYAHVEALAGLLGAVIGGILVLVGDFGRRWADTRQSQVQRLANAAVEFRVPIANLVADIRDARDRHEPTARIPSRGRRYEASIRLYVTPGSEELEISPSRY
jgi:hypothetical protein